MTDCPNCILLNAVADDGRARVCEPCRRAAAPRVAARPLAPLPPPGAGDFNRNAPPPTYDAACDMQALARHPRVRAMGWEFGRATDEPAPAALADDAPARDIEDAEARERRQERSLYRAHHARARLAAMVARGPEGRRLAHVVWTHYGQWGEKRREYVSAAEELARTFGARDERAAFRDHLVRTGVRAKQLDAITARAYGNALLGVAVAAYERDAWESVVPPPSAPPPNARAAFATRVAEAWAAAKRWIADGG